VLTPAGELTPAEPTTTAPIAAAPETQQTSTPVKVWCTTCGTLVVNIEKMTVLSKIAGTVRCNVCRTNTTALYRNFGTWPTDEFKRASVEEQQLFMKNASVLPNKALISSAKCFLAKYERHEKTYEEGGAFFPLSKWSKDGFDAERIERLTPDEDIMEHDILGKVYRVAILYKSIRGAQGAESSKRLRSNMKNAAKQIADEPAVIGGASSSTVVPAIEPKPAEVPTPCDNNGDASSKQGSNKSKSSSNSSSKSSSSSASSSSSSKKTKKKKKTGKKEVKKTLKTHGKAKKKDDARKKELAKKTQKKSEAARKQAKITADEEKQVKKLADAEAKAHSAATKKAQADQKKSFTSASGNLDKINKALEVLNANLLSPHVVCMPPQVMTTIRSCLSKLNELANECRDVMIHGGLTVDANIVKEAFLAAKKSDAVFAALAKRIGDMQITS